ncbi:MAG: hypothetical protein ABIQ93_16950 [Saprospiraceae bacterium]
MPLAIALILLSVLLLGVAGAALAGLLAAGVAAMIGLFWMLLKWSTEVQAADSVRLQQLTPAAVDAMPKSPDFHLSAPGTTFRPTLGSTDSAEAIRFKTALKDVNSILVASNDAGVQPLKVQLNLAAFANTAFLAIDPEKTIPKYIWQGIFLPLHIGALLPEKFDEVWGYPEFDIPMYKPLAGLSDELFLPNLNLIEQNSITLLQTNRRFIEAYMLGLNHEFARELLWREYPTDQRGSSFRQFWDVKGMRKPTSNPALTDAQWKEILRDISPIHRWRDPLGENDKPTEGEKIKENIVLVIRGELLKKYPTAVIYAHKAKWQLQKDKVTIDNKVERVLVEISDAQEDDPPRTIVKTPLFEAKIEPDIYFFGFDLEPLEARGGTGETQADLDNPGWFFVIKERPGEPRFGFDIDRKEHPESIYTWNDLAWPDLKITNSYIDLTVGGANDPNRKITLKTPPAPLGQDDLDRDVQHGEDVNVKWQDGSGDTNAADLAYILYQVPVMVAVHAAEMLPKPK